MPSFPFLPVFLKKTSEPTVTRCWRQLMLGGGPWILMIKTAWHLIFPRKSNTWKRTLKCLYKKENLWFYNVCPTVVMWQCCRDTNSILAIGQKRPELAWVRRCQPACTHILQTRATGVRNRDRNDLYLYRLRSHFSKSEIQSSRKVKHSRKMTNLSS